MVIIKTILVTNQTSYSHNSTVLYTVQCTVINSHSSLFCQEHSLQSPVPECMYSTVQFNSGKQNNNKIVQFSPIIN